MSPEQAQHTIEFDGDGVRGRGRSRGNLRRRLLALLLGAGALSTGVISALTGSAGAADPIPSGSVQLEQWQDVPETWTTGTLNDNFSNYAEGEAVPFRLIIDAALADGTYDITVCRDYANGPRFGYLFLTEHNASRFGAQAPDLQGALITDSADSIFTGAVANATATVGIGAVVNDNVSTGCGADILRTIVTVTISGPGTKYVLWGGHLASPFDVIPTNPPNLVGQGNSASFFSNGGSLAMRLETENRGISVNAILPTGALVVDKVQVGGVANTTFMVDIDCAGTLFDFFDQQITDAVSIMRGPIPTGTVCTVVEEANLAFSTGYSPATANTTGITIPQGTATVTVTNTRKAGSLVVDKVQIGGVANTTFTVDINCGGTLFNDVQVTDATSATRGPFDTGTVCTVVEDPNTAFSTGYSPAGGGGAQITIAEGTNTVTVTNTRKAGSLVVDKVQIGGVANTTFTVDINCGGTLFNDVQVTDATSATRGPFDTGTVCTVVEDANTAFSTGYSPAGGGGAQITIAEGTNTVTVTNTRKAGSLVVDKVQIGGVANTTFTVDINCGGTLFNDVQVTDATSATRGPFDTGTVCTVVEDPNTAFSTGYSPAGGGGAQITIAEGTNTVTVTNTRKAGSLVVDKVQIGGVANTTFTVDINCGGTLFNDVQVTDATSATRGPFDTGTVCTVVEDPNTAFSTGYSPAGGGGAQITIAEGTNTVTVTNTRKAGSLVVDKVQIGGVANTTFTVDINCGGTLFNDVQVTDATSATRGPFDTGTVCTVVEDPNTAFSTGYSPAGGGGAQITIAEGTNTVTVTNTRKAGSLVVDKVQIGGVANTTFTVDINCGGTLFNDVQVTDATSATRGPFDTGTVCTVVEDANTAFSTGYSPAGGGGAQITIAEGTNTVTVTNTRNTSALRVTKTVVGGTGTETFTVDIDCVDGDTFDRSNLTISPGNPVGVDGIPTGTECTVTEDPDDPDLFTPTYDPAQTVTIDDDGETVAITNTRNTASLTVTKTIVGGTGNETFTVDINCPLDANDLTDATLSVATPVVVNGIPTGSSCTVTEDPDNPDLFTPSYNPGQTVVVGDNGATVAVTNTRNTSALRVTKTVVGGAGTETFTVDIDCAGGDTFDRSNLTISAANPVGVDGIPTGTECTVTEDPDDPDLFTPSYSPGQTVTIDDDGETVAITNTRFSTIIIKEQTIPAGLPDEFGFIADPPLDPATFTLKDGESQSYLNLAAGDYKVTQDELFFAAQTIVQQGIFLASIDCDDANSVGSVPDRTASLTLEPGETVTCTFVNVLPEEGKIIVRKVVDQYDTGQEFPFEASYDEDGFSLETGEENVSESLPAGTYSVKELVPDGWDLESAVCSDGSDPDAIELGAEETVVCTFTNEREPEYDGDTDNHFDTPFDDAGDPGTPAPTGDTAGTNDQTGQQPAPAPQPVVAPGTTTRPEDPAGPVALDQLPRTGQGLDRVTLLGGLFLALGGVAVYFGRRRKAQKA